MEHYRSRCFAFAPDSLGSRVACRKSTVTYRSQNHSCFACVPSPNIAGSLRCLSRISGQSHIDASTSFWARFCEAAVRFSMRRAMGRDNVVGWVRNCCGKWRANCGWLSGFVCSWRTRCKDWCKSLVEHWRILTEVLWGKLMRCCCRLNWSRFDHRRVRNGWERAVQQHSASSLSLCRSRDSLRVISPCLSSSSLALSQQSILLAAMRVLICLTVSWLISFDFVTKFLSKSFDNVQRCAILEELKKKYWKFPPMFDSLVYFVL